MPTYNRAHVLERAIRSVLNQTYEDFELIIVDDGSTDNTRDIIKQFKQQDKRVRYIKHKTNKGVAASRNTGIKKARGEYIAFQDSDDEWLPKKLERQVSIITTSSQDVGVVYTGFYKIRGYKKIYIPSKSTKITEGFIHYDLLKGNFIGTPTVLARKECFKSAGLFDTRLVYLEDWDMWIRISKYYKFKFINEPLVLSYYSPGGVNEKLPLYQAITLEQLLKKYYSDFTTDPSLLSKMYYIIGHAYILGGNLQKGQYYLRLAINVRKSKIILIPKLSLSLMYHQTKCIR